MNAKVRRYYPFPHQNHPHRLSTTSPTWKHNINQEVTDYYNQVKDRQPKITNSPKQKTVQARSAYSYQGKLNDGVRSCSTISYTETTPIKSPFEDNNHANWRENSNLHKEKVIEGQKQLQIYYSQRLLLLEEECIYLRKQFIRHCLKHHKTQFESLSRD